MGSTRTSPSEGGGTGGSFKCDFPRCNKTFTRKDHLIRHQANHSTTTFPCPICGRLFKRLDLLQRHEKRNICGEAGPSTTPRRLTPSNTGGKSLSKQMQKPQKRKRSPSSSSSSSGSSGGVLSPVQLLADKAGLELINGWNRTQDEEEHEGWETSAREMQPPPFGRVSDLGQGLDLERLLVGSKVPRGKREEISVSGELILRLQADFSAYDNLFTDAETHIATFFSSFAPSYPIIHRPTFDPNSAATPSHLIVLIIVLGSVTSSSSSTPTSGPSSPDYSALVRSIRTDLFNKLESQDLEIEILQTLTLCYIYEYHFAPPDRADQTNKRSMARRDKAGLWWAGVVAHLTRQGIGVTDTQELEDGDAFGNGETGQEGEVGRLWRRWVKQEARLRLAYTIIHLDLLTPLYTHHPPSRPYPFISYDLPLPASRALWDCPTAEEWVQLYSLSRRDRSNGKSSTHNQADDLPGGMVSVLRGMLAGPKGPVMPELKVDLDHAFAVRSVVLGLIGVGWDCKVYGPHMYPATEESEGDKSTAKRWRKGIQDAVIHLRATWEGATQHLPSCTEIRDMRDLFGISILSVLSDIPTLLGMNTSPPSPTATTRAQVWVKTDDAFTCLWQSARYLKQALFADWGTYTAEVVYLSTLVLYVYATCSLPASIQAFSSSSPSKGTHTLLDSILISNTKPHLAGRHILDLLTCSAEMLSTKSYPRSDPALPRVLKGLIGKHIVADGAEDEDVGSCIRDMGLLAELLPESLLPTSLDFVSKKDLGVGTTDVSER